MTMKPKARKFRIKRGGAGTLIRSAAATAAMPDDDEDTMPPRTGADTAPRERPAPRDMADGDTPIRLGAGPGVTRGTGPSTPSRPTRPASTAPGAEEPVARSGQVSPPDEVAGEDGIEAIRREGLTSRQLRMARRVAEKHNLDVTSDFDAVFQLRKAGIDPFRHSNMLELVVPRSRDSGSAAQGGAGDPPAGGDTSNRHPIAKLPQTLPETARETLPSTDLSPAERRNREIAGIQRDIMLRRRRKMLLLLARLSFFVFLPTFLAGWYFYVAATPMYSTKAEFLILQADNTGGGGIGGLLAGTQFATNQDAIAVQSYLESKDAMLRLDRDVGFKAHFEQDWIDPIQRLAPDADNEQAYKVYKKRVKIGYDPTEGVIRMEISAADPEISAEFARKLITYAEERVNNLSEKKREDQMRDALQSFEKSQDDRRAAQEHLVRLQQEGALLDPEGVISSLRAQISNVEVQLQERQLDLAALTDNARPNQARVEGARGDIRRLQNLLDELNTKMTDASKGENSLAQLTARIQMAQADLATRDLLLQSALQQVEQTRMEANRQVRYLTTSVLPVPSQSPSYPRSFEDTILAFLIFSGVYLMISLTASILREQVTS
ncbi:capsule biosynthesis protein [Marinibacterium sp. SX1]|uniref:capsule biosynthesis protein n=1 Tax=Marinibacterium sp. SX1 TaxID=3388424 RepID=UPI003D17C8BF